MPSPNFAGATIADHEDNLLAYGPAVPASAAPKYCNLKNADNLEVVVEGLNGAAGVTGSAITLTQATNSSGSNAKALSFAVHYAAEDASNTTVPVQVATVNSTFTTTNTASKAYVYRIPVRPAMLDVNGGFCYLGVGVANAANTTLKVSVRVLQKYNGAATNNPNLIG